MSGMLRRGAAISAVTLFVVQAVALVQTLVVARLLSPAEIGIFAAGTVLTTFLVTFTEGGLSQALIQREHDVEDAADTVFWATIVAGVLMSLLMLAVAPLIALFFDSRTAGVIAAITSGTLLLHAFTTVPDALMQRRFNFKRRLIVDPSIAISFAVVSIVLCSLGYGVWGLVIATYVSLLVWIATTWLLAKWRPGRGRPSVLLWRGMARFSLPMVIDGIVERSREVIDSAVVGRVLGVPALGHYRYGRRIAMLPGVAVVHICSYVLFPAFSRIAGDPQRLKSAFLRALGWIWFAAAPVAALLVALGQPAVVVLLGEQWREAGLALVAMAGFGLGEAMNAVSGESMKGAGRSQRLNWMTFVGLVLGVGLLILLIPFGLVGVGLAISITAISVGLTGLWLARPVVGVSTTEILGKLIPPAVAALAALAVIAPLEHLVVESDERTVPAALGLLTLETLGFGLLYLVVLRLIAPATVASLTSGAWALLARVRRAAPSRSGSGP